MGRRESQEMSVEMRRELEALDTALGGGAVDAEHVELADLAIALHALRPQPREEFAQSLDARAAHGFTRERDRRTSEAQSPERLAARRWPRGRGNPRNPTRTALSLVVVAIVAAAVAIPLSLSGGGPVRPAGPVRTPERSLPAVSAPAPASGAMAGARQSSAAPSPGTRQVERTASLDLGVAPASIESTARQVFSLVSAFHGYVQQSSVSSGGGEQSGASFDLRLPSSNLSGALAALAHLGHVRSENDTTNDVTEPLDSLRRSLGDAQAERKSLLTRLAHTSEPERIAVLEAQLRALEAHISQLRGALRALTSRIDYTSVALSLTPERSNGAAGADLTPGGAAHDAARILTAALAVLVLAGAALIPFAAIAAAGWIALTVTRRRMREQALDAS